MPIIATGGNATTFKPAPAGVHTGVCCDVVDMGLLEVTYAGQTKKQHKVRLVWQIEELMDDGKPFIVQKRYTLSLHEKSNLRLDLQSWRGRAFTEDELRGFDLEKLIGVNCMLNIVHTQKGGETYANVTAVMPLKKNMPSIVVSKDYVRFRDRTEAQQKPAGGNGDGPDDPFGDDMVPF
jgi:hypothetical protein